LAIDEGAVGEGTCKFLGLAQAPLIPELGAPFLALLQHVVVADARLQISRVGEPRAALMFGAACAWSPKRAANQIHAANMGTRTAPDQKRALQSEATKCRQARTTGGYVEEGDGKGHLPCPMPF